MSQEPQNFFEELKAELKAAVIQDLDQEIREIVRDEIKRYIFDTKSIDKSLRTYIKSLCFDDIYYLRMLNGGLLKQETGTYIIPETSTGKIRMNKKENVDLKKLYKEYLKTGHITCTYDDFKSVMNFEHDVQIIDWRDKGKKTFTYKSLFELYNRIYDYNFSELKPVVEYRILLYISVKFKFQNQIKDIQDIRKSFHKTYKSKKTNK